MALHFSDDAQLNQYFGEPWQASVCNEGISVPVPVGKPCSHCKILMTPYDRGVFLADISGERSPVHRECVLRMVLGSPAHLRGECMCFNPVNASCKKEVPTTPEGKRAEAIESWKIYTKLHPVVSDPR